MNPLNFRDYSMFKKLNYYFAMFLAASVFSLDGYAAGLNEFLSNGDAYGDFRLRYESVEQNNAADDASAFTLRTKLGYKIKEMNGFSGVIEFEDSRVVAKQNDYNFPGSGGTYSVIADPETTELDQGFLQYKTGIVTGKLGRQVITFDNHRFVGHVGWRQDRQTFDALMLSAAPSDELKIDFAHINKRNRIFAETGDVISEDNLLNASYKTPYGKLSAYSYMLSVDLVPDNALDTVGFRFAGSTAVSDFDLLYTLELASQTAEAVGVADIDTGYSLVEAGVKVKGVMVKVANEVLGSDNGAAGFATPLATLHKFNGWADVFLATPAVGLVDTTVSVASKLGPGKLAAAFHTYSADEGTATVDDLGDEINVAYTFKLKEDYKFGVKAASYSAGDAAAGYVDTDKLWVWVSTSI